MKRNSLLVIMISLVFAISVFADVPRTLSYQGKLTDELGNTVPDGDYQIAFSIWNQPQGGDSLWGETKVVTVTGGLFICLLGSYSPFPQNLFADSSRYLAIRVGGDNELVPRTKLTPSAFSYHALHSDTAGYATAIAAQSITSEMIMDTTITFDKFAHNNGEPGDIIAFSQQKNGIHWEPYPVADIIEEPVVDLIGQHAGWIDEGAVIRLMASGDMVGIGVIPPNPPEAKLHVYEYREDVDPLHVSTYDADMGDYDNRLVVNSSGRVGIGTASPLSPLGVIGQNNWDWNVGDGWGDFSIGDGTYGLSIGVALQGGGTGAIRFWARGGTETIRFSNVTNGDLMIIKQNGNVGIGAQNPAEKLTVRGNILVLSESSGLAVAEIGEGLDYAEGFDIADVESYEPGTVLIIDPDNPGKLTVSTNPYDTRVAGIVAGANALGSGVKLGAGQYDIDVALAGRVYCNVDAAFGAIQPGDLLTTAPVPGYAMVVRDNARAQGAIIGKAMGALEAGQKGQILVLVTLQ